MDLYLDSADLDEIRVARDLGVWMVSPPTFPSLRKQVQTFTNAWPRFASCARGPSPQVTATEHDAMLEEAEPLLEIGEQIVIKLPCTTDGIARAQFVGPWGSNQFDTLLQPLQLLGRYVSAFLTGPFIGRLDDIGQDGMDLIQQIERCTTTMATRPKCWPHRFATPCTRPVRSLVQTSRPCLSK